MRFHFCIVCQNLISEFPCCFYSYFIRKIAYCCFCKSLSLCWSCQCNFWFCQLTSYDNIIGLSINRCCGFSCFQSFQCFFFFGNPTVQFCLICYSILWIKKDNICLRTICNKLCNQIFSSGCNLGYSLVSRNRIAVTYSRLFFQQFQCKITLVCIAIF